MPSASVHAAPPDLTADGEIATITTRPIQITGTRTYDATAVATAANLAIAAPGGGQFTLSFLAHRATGTGYTGLTRKYTVESTTNPANPASWQPVTGYTNLVGGTQSSNITGDDQTVTVTMPVTGQIQFYRLSVRVE